jgi:hypothetical protein
MEELILLLYNKLEWENIYEILKKIKIVKLERKNIEKKIVKEKQKKYKSNKLEEDYNSCKLIEIYN